MWKDWYLKHPLVCQVGCLTLLCQSRFRHAPLLDDRLYKSSAVAEMGERLATVDMGLKDGGLLCPFWGDKRRSETEATAGHKH